MDISQTIRYEDSIEAYARVTGYLQNTRRCHHNTRTSGQQQTRQTQHRASSVDQVSGNNPSTLISGIGHKLRDRHQETCLFNSNNNTVLGQHNSCGTIIISVFVFP